MREYEIKALNQKENLYASSYYSRAKEAVEKYLKDKHYGFRTAEIVRHEFVKAYIEAAEAEERETFIRINALFAWVKEEFGVKKAVEMMRNKDEQDMLMAQFESLPEYSQRMDKCRRKSAE